MNIDDIKAALDLGAQLEMTKSAYEPDAAAARLAPACVCNVASRVLLLRQKFNEFDATAQAKLKPFIARLPFEEELLSGKMDAVDAAIKRIGEHTITEELAISLLRRYISPFGCLRPLRGFMVVHLSSREREVVRAFLNGTNAEVLTWYEQREDMLTKLERISGVMANAQKIILVFAAGVIFATLLMVACYLWTGGK